MQNPNITIFFLQINIRILSEHLINVFVICELHFGVVLYVQALQLKREPFKQT